MTATREARIAAAMRARERFSDFLRSHRVASEKSLEQISVITKIPERSLRSLEDGKFDALPADVFVRGFLRSYASCLGLEADDVLKRYAACGVSPSPVASELAASPGAATWHDDGAGEVGAARPTPTQPQPSEPAPERVAATTAVEAPEAKPSRASRASKRNKRTSAPPAQTAHGAAEPRTRVARTTQERTFLPPVGLEDGLPRRGPLTLAVIILVIVATLAMSYLLRTPSDSGDGITRRRTPSPTSSVG